MKLGDADSVSQYFKRCDLFAGQKVESVVRLKGGVSADTFRVKLSKTEVVLKRPLRRLRVQKDWFSSPERAFNEFMGLSLASPLLPKGSVPLPLYFDEAENLVVMSGAPASFRDWKSLLMEGEVRQGQGKIVADYLGRLHTRTQGNEFLESVLRNSRQFFRQLRLRPYFYSLMPQYEDLKPKLMEVVRILETKRRCIVHGDFSPKNILTDGERSVMIIDWEVVHYGNPVFDVAFMSNHLTLKAIHFRNKGSKKYLKLLSTFCGTYFSSAGRRVVDLSDFFRVLGALLLARVDGKSPAEYLSEDDKGRVRSLSKYALTNEFGSVGDYYDKVSEATE